MAIEEIAPGILQEWLYDDRIVAFTIQNISRSSIDAYIEASLQIIRTWPKDRDYLVINTGSPRIIITPYLHRRAEELGYMATKRGLRGKNALVTPNKAANYIARLILREKNPYSPQVTKRVFLDRQSALNWLYPGITPTNQQNVPGIFPPNM
jgi:hypothetical protein